jgi:signal transduction histidine kinase
MEEGGDLRIETRKNESGVEVDGIDDGPGIPDDVRPRIFDLFFTTKGVGEGSGLGLDIVQRIVRTHGSHIDVRSKPGRTEMRVQLPITSLGGQCGPRCYSRRGRRRSAQIIPFGVR